MARIAVVRENNHMVSLLLQPNRRIDNQPLSAANPQIRMEKHDCALRRARDRVQVSRRRHGGQQVCVYGGTFVWRLKLREVDKLRSFLLEELQTAGNRYNVG